MPTVKFQHKAVQDLYWALASPSPFLHIPQSEHTQLISTAPGQFNASKQINFFHQLDQSPQIIHQWIHARRKTYALGRYFEHLIAFFLTHSSHTQLIDQNHQFTEKGITKGESDFIYFCHKRQQTIHLEVAVKFYLGYEQKTEWENWIGPNSQDRLSIKLPKLIHHQAALCQQNYAQAYLQSLDIQEIQSEVLLRGRFYKKWDTREHQPSPLHASPTHLVGWWMYESEAKQLLPNEPAAYWRVLHKLEWMCAHQASHWYQAYDTQLFLQNRLQKTLKKPIQVAQLSANGKHELSRGFIVPNDWP